MAKANPTPATTTRAKAQGDAPLAQTQIVLPKSAPTPIEIARANVQAKAEAGVGVTLHTSGKFIKGLSAEPVVARPQRKMLRVIDSIKGHPGRGNMVKRFHLYTVGMTLLHTKVTEGLIPSDVTYYAELGYLTLRDCTDAEYDAAVKAWEATKTKPEVTTQAA